MTNQEKTDKLFGGANWALQDMERALEQGEWNIAMRRAQEVVEATLKGLLTLMGADYPKEHDPSKVFARIARERGLEVPDETLNEIQTLSADLARKRAPAVSFELEISSEEARHAAGGA